MVFTLRLSSAAISPGLLPAASASMTPCSRVERAARVDAVSATVPGEGRSRKYCLPASTLLTALRRASRPAFLPTQTGPLQSPSPRVGLRDGQTEDGTEYRLGRAVREVHDFAWTIAAPRHCLAGPGGLVKYHNSIVPHRGGVRRGRSPSVVPGSVQIC